MYIVYRDGGKYVVDISISFYLFWKRTYQYICDTEEDVKNLVIPDDKLYINDDVPIEIRPYTSLDENATYWSCILNNNNTHKGEVRILTHLNTI